MSHRFYIPVLGLGFSIDTPIKVARFGISSVISIVDDMLIERMRKFYLETRNEEYTPIGEREPDKRARRITAYLNLVDTIVREDFERLRKSAMEPGSEITRYFELLPEDNALRATYLQMTTSSDAGLRSHLQDQLRRAMTCGSIDVNIMSKLDKLNFSADRQPLDETYSDALAALRGFAESKLTSSVVFSAGMNPRLYGYLEQFSCFYPRDGAPPGKSITLKVSDFRSAFIQAKYLAKKGLWVSEFRIESGLNCGGHAFATDGFLLGPVLEEFKRNRQEMLEELSRLYQLGLAARGMKITCDPAIKLGVQGGIGTAAENNFLLRHYQVDATGWGSPFLLVPEATNVDEETLQNLVRATSQDFYISNSSPLGVPFNNFKNTSMERLRLARIANGRPGSPCKKKYLVSNTEFTDLPICVASREYQQKKIQQLDALALPAEAYETRFNEITAKECLCEGLAVSAYLKNQLLKPREDPAVSICPGPNVVHFSGIFSLDDMIRHIYGKVDLLRGVRRANMFINELNLYITYLKTSIESSARTLSTALMEKRKNYFVRFRKELQAGIHYYRELIPRMSDQPATYLNEMLEELRLAERSLTISTQLLDE